MDYVVNLESHIGITAECLFQRLAQGQVDSDPFARDARGLRKVVDLVQVALTDDSGSAVAQVGDVPQPVRVRLLQRVLKLGGGTLTRRAWSTSAAAYA